jgi:hypothetical protein
MLKILSDILSWSDVEREKAGLQRMGAGTGPASPIVGKRAEGELEKGDVTEVCSNTFNVRREVAKSTSCVVILPDVG